MITALQGSTYVGDLRVGGMGSRILSNLVTCGGSSELMDKRDRRRLSLPEVIETLKAELNRLNIKVNRYHIVCGSIQTVYLPKSLFYRVDQFEPIGSGTTTYQTGPIFCPPKDGKVNFHVQQKFEVYLEPAPIF